MIKTIRVSLFSLAFVCIFLLKKNIFAASYDLINLTKEELLLYVSHPAEAISAKAAADEAERYTEKHFTAYTRWQGNGDAFRHAYWSALMTKRIDRDFAYDAGLAHEGLKRGYVFDWQNDDTKMDISNNYSGRILGTEFIKHTDTVLRDNVVSAVLVGNLKRVRTHTTGNNYEMYGGEKTKFVGYYVATSDGGFHK